MFRQPGCKTVLKTSWCSEFYEVMKAPQKRFRPYFSPIFNMPIEFVLCLIQEKDTKYSSDYSNCNDISKFGRRMLPSDKTRLPLKGQAAITAAANTREVWYSLPNHDHAHVFFRSSALQSPTVLRPATLSSAIFPPVSKLTLISGPPLCSARLGWLQCFTAGAAWPPRQASVSANKNIIAKSLQLPISAGEPLLLHWHACQGTLN